MIDVEKWKQSDDKQKLKMCQAIAEGANERAISKEDWILMFKFLLSQVKQEQ